MILLTIQIIISITSTTLPAKNVGEKLTQLTQQYATYVMMKKMMIVRVMSTLTILILHANHAPIQQTVLNATEERAIVRNAIPAMKLIQINLV